MGWVEDKIEHIAAAVSLEAERTRLEVAQAFAQTQRGLRIDGALARPIIPNAMNYLGGRRLVGWSVRAAGGDVTITLRDGHDASGEVIGTIALVAGQSETVTVMPAGVSFAEGLYVASTGAGAPVGALWIGAVD